MLPRLRLLPRFQLPARLRRDPDGLALLDVLLGMAIFALIAVIAVQSMGLFRERAYVTTAVSDAKQISSALEAARTAPGVSAYPNPTTALPAGVNLSRGVTAAGFATSADGEKFAVCAAHSGGAWALYDSSFGTVVATGKGSSPAACTAPVVGAVSPSGPTAAPTPSTPALAAPQNVTVTVAGDTATVAWDPVPAAVSYAVHVDAAATAAWAGAQTVATITELAPGDHTIAVAATDGKTFSPMSRSASFAAEAPVWKDVTGVSGSYGLTRGVDNKFYAVASDSLLRIDLAGNATTLATGLGTVLQSTQASDGNFYLTGGNTGNLYRVTPAGVRTTVASGLGTATAIAQGPDGNLYVGNGAGDLYRISLSGTVTTFATGFSYIGGVVWASDGNLYVTSNTTGAMTRVSATGTKTPFATGLSGAAAVIQASSGEFYVAGGVSGNAYRVTSAGVVSTFKTGQGTVLGITRDSAGSLYISTRVNGDGRIVKIS